MYRFKFKASAILTGILLGSSLSSVFLVAFLVLGIAVVLVRYRDATGYLGAFGPLIDTWWLMMTFVTAVVSTPIWISVLQK